MNVYLYQIFSTMNIMSAVALALSGFGLLLSVPEPDLRPLRKYLIVVLILSAIGVIFIPNTGTAWDIFIKETPVATTAEKEIK